MEILVNNKNITIDNNSEDSKLNIGFIAGENYSTLYVSAEELNPSDNIGVKWSPIILDEIKIDNIAIKHMSNYEKRFVLFVR